MPLPHIVHIGQGQMLGGRQVAQEVHAHAHGHGSADGSGDVVIPRRGVDGQGSEHVERRAVGHLFDADDLRLDFVHRHMAGSFDHALHAVFEAALGKRARGS